MKLLLLLFACCAIACVSALEERADIDVQHLEQPRSKVEKVDDKPGAKDEEPRKLDLNLMKGKWFEIARSRHARGETGCECNIAVLNVEGNTVNSEYACLNSSAKEPADKFVRASARCIATDRDGVFTTKMLNRSPGKLSESAQKETKSILLALGPDFMAVFDTERKVLHMMSRNTTMDKELFAALLDLAKSVGVNADEILKVKQDKDHCSKFHDESFKKLEGVKKDGSASDLDKGRAKMEDKKPNDDDSKREKAKITAASEGVSAAEQQQFDEQQALNEQQLGEQPLGEQQFALPPNAPAPAAPAEESNAPAPPPLDLNLLAGNWFLIASSQSGVDRYGRGCTCTQGFGSVVDANTLNEVTACHNTTDNQMVTCVHRKTQEAGSPGIFKVQQLDLQPYGLRDRELHEFVLVALGKDFQVISEPAINAAWIISRTPIMAPELFERLSNLLDRIGFAKASLVKSNHDLPQCAAVTQAMQNMGQKSAQPVAPAAPIAPAAPAAPAAALPPAPVATPLPPAAPAPAAAPPMGQPPRFAGEQQQLGGGEAFVGSEMLGGPGEEQQQPLMGGGTNALDASSNKFLNDVDTIRSIFAR